MAADDGDDNAYSWEAGYAEGLNIREALREDASGSLQPAIADLLDQAKRQRRILDRPVNVRLGIMRHVYIVVDCSACMTETDLLPSRIACVVKALKKFLEKFFEQNPISQLGLIIAKDKRAERLTELTGNVRRHKDALSKVTHEMCFGEMSLQNSLDLAGNVLRHLPAHTSREIIVIMGSLSTCDPSNVDGTFEILKRHGIRCSVIGLSAEVHVCKKLATETGGDYRVILDEHHLETVLHSHTSPPISAIYFSHIDDLGKVQPTAAGYFCPQCGAKYCSIPIECKICRLTLVAAPQLARAFQHLTPLAPFKELTMSKSGYCSACGRLLHADSRGYQCEKCTNLFCLDCDLLLCDSLKVCPGCVK